MSNYPNYRVAVEAVINNDNKVLLVKRSMDCAVAPGVWNVPARKVEYEEIPTEAVIRECKEEIGVDVKIEKEIGCRAFKTKSNNEDAFRLVFTYLVEISNGFSKENIKLNDTHSEYCWVDKSEIDGDNYSSLMEKLKQIIMLNAFES